MEVKKTLSEQIYSVLRNDIIKQDLKCGKKLTLLSLRRRFNVSHTPIRDALTRLSEEGLVDYRSNKSINVVSFSNREIKELYQFIGELDSLAIKFCQYSYTKENLLLELKESLYKFMEAENALDIDKRKDNSDAFHLLFYKYAENHYLDEAAKKVRAKIELLSNIYFTDENAGKIYAFHKSILTSLEADNFEEAQMLMKKHLKFDMLIALKAMGN